MDFKSILSDVMNGQDLSRERMKACMDAIMGGELTDAQISGILVSLLLERSSVVNVVKFPIDSGILVSWLFFSQKSDSIVNFPIDSGILVSRLESR